MQSSVCQQMDPSLLGHADDSRLALQDLRHIILLPGSLDTGQAPARCWLKGDTMLSLPIYREYCRTLDVQRPAYQVLAE